jgi:iron complex outermembrane recepter protein
MKTIPLEAYSYVTTEINGSIVNFNIRKALEVVIVLLAIIFCYCADLEAATRLPSDLTKMSLEDLMSVEVTSVSKKAEKLSDAAAAVFVITQEDIRRCGVTSIPEVLRMVPGLQVARIDANKWAISSRGFNGRYANKLLVLMDGRTVYTPYFSGVYWDVQDTLLEDIERIEVIRGPGATLWGANAVNGVINVITKKAGDTQGGLVYGGSGTEEKVLGGARFGAKLGEDASYRIYAKYFKRDEFSPTSDMIPPSHKAIQGIACRQCHARFIDGSSNAPDWEVLRGGVRLDWERSSRDSLTLQGDIYSGTTGESSTVASLEFPFARPIISECGTRGGNILARLNHSFSESSDMVLQVYYDRTDRDEMSSEEIRDTVDIDFQHRFIVSERQEILWGMGYRYTRDDFTDSFTYSLDPESRGDQLFSSFLQNEITLIPSRVRLTLGSKFEHNDYTGFEVQPDARLQWIPHERHTVWAAISRAVRTPSRAEHNIRIASKVLPPGTSGPLPVLLAFFGNENFDSEELLAYEVGYRVCPMDRLSLDVAAFYNVYDNLRIGELGAPVLEVSPSPAHILQPIDGTNNNEAETYGVELAIDWRAANWWRLQAAYTFLKMHTQFLGEGREIHFLGDESGLSPQNQVSVRSLLDLPGNLEFDLWLRYVDNLPSIDVDSYITLDVRLGWKPRQNLELSLVGQNLFDSQHLEFKPELNSSITEVPYSFYAKATWSF